MNICSIITRDCILQSRHTHTTSEMGSLCLRSRQQTAVVPMDKEEDDAGFHELKRQVTITSTAQDGLLHSSWQEENKVSFAEKRQRSRERGGETISHSNSFMSRTSLKFFRRNSVRPSPSTAVLLQQSLSMTIDGSILRKYSVHNIIGKGAFSTVIQIEDKATEKQYALKVIEKKRSFHTNVPWERELNILKKVHHESIVNLIETHATTSKVYFVLELALGGDLQKKLSSIGHFSESKAHCLLSPLLDGLRYLHKHGVTHRDLKLDNCLFKTNDEDSPILLSDFGLAYLQSKEKENEGMLLAFNRTHTKTNALYVIIVLHTISKS